MQSMRPLAGIKVVEIGTMVTAPLAAMLLAQMGADVIKVENPAGGDPFRRATSGGYSPNFIAYNQNKRSIQLDLASGSGRAELLELVADADILIENFRPGVMDRLGLTREVLNAVNPALVYCSITGFGADGPYAERPAYDTVGIALSGILHMYLDRDQPDVRGPTLADNVTGLYAVGGVLAALHARRRTGEGQRVEINMLESAIAFAPDAFAYLSQRGEAYGPHSRVASSQSFVWKCADGGMIAIHLSVPEKFWLGLLDALGARDSLGRDPRFLTAELRIANYQLLSAELAAVGITRSRDEWAALLRAHDVPFAPVNSIGEVLDDPQVRHLGTFAEVDHVLAGKVVGIRNPLRINGERSSVQAPPTLGEHAGARFGADRDAVKPATRTVREGYCGQPDTKG
ncbi:CaiB/BaiF CoA transferase family protein [Aquibium microcysteis]|uniref:CaiB/BaiF CoA transferase family protein n=1 Tax=Aquibium microcysteis TaxID=675281 RepID=UPI001EF1D7FC|nr:CaiB/BaiF CoA-transferase family protein [Aquibium microcysteis]